jgi:hypothetical protein
VHERARELSAERELEDMVELQELEDKRNSGLFDRGTGGGK